MERLYDIVAVDNDDMLRAIMYASSDNIELRDRANDIKMLNTKQPGLIDALRILEKYRGSFYNDNRGDNIMQRKDGTIVLIDPYGPINR